MNEKTQQLFEALATKLNTTAEQVWGILVRQAMIKSFTYLFLLIIMNVLLVLAYQRISKYQFSAKDAQEVTWGAWAIVVLVTFLWVCFHAVEIMTGFLNPEFMAIQEIRKSL